MKDNNEILAEVKEQTESVTSLIEPEDLIHQDIDSWENADIEHVKNEMHEGMSEWSYMASHPYSKSIHEIAMNMWQESLKRVPFDHLVFDSREKCILEGYWPNDMDKWECREILEENYETNQSRYDYFWSEAKMKVESAVLDAYVEELEE